jgi:hypothetical protein
MSKHLDPNWTDVAYLTTTKTFSIYKPFPHQHATGPNPFSANEASRDYTLSLNCTIGPSRIATNAS